MKINHLFAPFTSTPMIGTRAKKMNDITNIGVTNFFKSEVFKIEIKIIIIRARKVKVKCLEKKK